MMLSVLFILSLLIIFSTVDAKRFTKPKPVPAAPPPPVMLNVENLPPLEEILKEAKVDHRIKEIVKMGVVDTRLLLRLSKMDFQMMMMEWDNVTQEEIDYFKEVVDRYIILAIQAYQENEGATEVVDYYERDQAKHGRFVLADAVQSFEFIQGSFGARPPIGPREIVLADPVEACSVPDKSDKYKGKIVVAIRGICPFLIKTEFAFAGNADGVLIVNTEDVLEPVSSGLGVDPTITDKRVLSLSNIPVMSTPNTSWAAIKYSLTAASKAEQKVLGQFIPIKCGGKGTCEAVLESERSVSLEVSSGQMQVKTATSETRSFDFLTSNFGSRIPRNSIRLVLADPIDGCLVSSSRGGDDENWVLVTHRGKCRFDVKASNAEAAGARLIIVIDNMDSALQRIGAKGHIGDTIAIPSIIVTAEAGEFLESSIKDATSSHQHSTITLTPSTDNTLTDTWIELAFTEWVQGSDDDALIQLEGLIQKFEQNNSFEVVTWLKKRLKKMLAKSKIPTDEM